MRPDLIAESAALIARAQRLRAARGPDEVWIVWCRVSGGVTGHREAALKCKGEVVTFPTEAAAEAEAARLRATMGRHSLASFSYTAVRA